MRLDARTWLVVRQSGGQRGRKPSGRAVVQSGVGSVVAEEALEGLV